MLAPILRRFFPFFVAVTSLTGCAAIQEIAALRSVDFQLDRVADVRLAGIDVSRVQTASDLSLTDAARIAAALASREAPLSFRIHLRAENPVSNTVTARLLQMEWTLFLEDTETISGQIGRGFELRPGEPVDVPVDVSFDLLEFYERSGPDLIDLALTLAGQGGRPRSVAVRVMPTIDTALGAITYPRPITIVSGMIGQTE